MPRVNVRTQSPERYNQVRQEQERLIEQFACRTTLARLCPYCEHKVAVICRGSHGAMYVKCDKCGEDVFFPPVSFRIMHWSM